MGKAKPWKQLSSKRILNNPLLQVDEDIVELPNGKKSTYVLHAPTSVHSVIMIAVNKDKKILIQQEYSYPPNEIMWQLPGGSMEEGETVTEAALRELAEESGYSAHKTTELGYFYVNNRKSNRKQHIVLCEDLFKHKLQEDSDEFIDSNWLTLDEIHEKIKTGEFVNINLLATLNIWFHALGAQF